MKKNYVRSFLFSCVALSSIYSLNAQDKNAMIQEKVTDTTGNPTMIVFKKSAKYNITEAKQVLMKEATINNSSFKQVKTLNDEIGFTHQKQQQFHKGLKVEFGEYIFHSKSSNVESMSGAFYKIEKQDLAPKISRQVAFKKALNHIGAEKYMWQYPKAAKEMNNYKKPKGELLILPGDVIGKKEARLAYKFDMFATEPISRGYLYIDAHNGNVLLYNPIIKHAGNHGHVGKLNHKKIVNKIIKKIATSVGTANTRYSGTKNINTSLSGSNYILSDSIRKIYTRNANKQSPGYNVYPYVSNYTQFTDNDNNWTTAEHSTNKDDAALDAHWGAAMTYDYFKTKHNRNSYDGYGSKIRNYVHVGEAYDNAFWNGAVMSYGDGSSNGQEGNGIFDALTSLDITAHEIGHAICSSTAKLIYQKEPGALNEGFSDIWGAAVEHFAKGNGNDMNPDPKVWLIGDEIDRRFGSSALRSMSNPKERGQPDTYKGTNWKNTECGTPTKYNDYCGVHTNSSVLNYWFYLVSVGGSGTNDVGNSYNITGVGITKAANIAYRAESNYLTATSKFLDARNAMIKAAKDLYGDHSQEVISTTNAFYAVNVGDKYIPPCTLPAPTLVASNITDTGFTISWQAIPNAASYDFTIDGTTTNMSATTYTASGFSLGTEHKITVAAKCSIGNNGALGSITLNTTGTKPYCTSKAMILQEYIKRVQIGSIDNTSDNGNGYSDHTAMSTVLQKSTSATITVTPGWPDNSFLDGYAVWIDYNRDGDFDDAGETVWTNQPTKDTPVSGTFIVPETALDGPTRMRVSLKYETVPTACMQINYGEVEDYTVIISSIPPDTEAPSKPVNLTATNTTKTTTDLSWDSATDNVGVKEYDVLKDNTVITTIAGTTYKVTGLSESKTYSFSVKAKDEAGNISVESDKITVNTLGNNLTYCASKGRDSSYEWIDYVSFGGMTNSTGNDGGYKDFTNKLANVTAGDSYQLTVSAGFKSSSYTEKWTVWIDYNKNGTFEDSEKIASNSSSSSGNLTSNITIPSSAKLGQTRMRVSMKYQSISTACESFAYGEVEDYSVIITAPAPDYESPSNPTNLIAANTTQTTTDLSWTASTDNVGVKEYNIFKGSSLIATVTNTSYKATGLSANTTYTFSVKAKDDAGNISGASNEVTVTTLEVQLNYCNSKGRNSSYEWIDYVSFGGMTNSTGNDGGYKYFTNKIATVTRGSTNTLLISAGFRGTTYNEHWNIWIDLNKNGTFENNEKLASGNSSSKGNISAKITILNSAVLGNTRMRVSMKYNANPTACETFTYGEVEDYTVNITNSSTVASLGITNNDIKTINGEQLRHQEIPDLMVYPNPSSNFIHVRLNVRDSSKFNYRIVNFIGQVVKSGKISEKIDISKITKGIYILEVNDGQKILKSKLVKK